MDRGEYSCQGAGFEFLPPDIPESVGTVAFGFAQPPCDAGLPYSASGISHRFEYTCPLIKILLRFFSHDSEMYGKFPFSQTRPILHNSIVINNLRIILQYEIFSSGFCFALIISLFFFAQICTKQEKSKNCVRNVWMALQFLKRPGNIDLIEPRMVFVIWGLTIRGSRYTSPEDAFVPKRTMTV